MREKTRAQNPGEAGSGCNRSDSWFGFRSHASLGAGSGCNRSDTWFGFMSHSSLTGAGAARRPGRGAARGTVSPHCVRLIFLSLFSTHHRGILIGIGGRSSGGSQSQHARQRWHPKHQRVHCTILPQLRCPTESPSTVHGATSGPGRRRPPATSLLRSQ